MLLPIAITGLGHYIPPQISVVPFLRGSAQVWGNTRTPALPPVAFRQRHQPYPAVSVSGNWGHVGPSSANLASLLPSTALIRAIPAFWFWGTGVALQSGNKAGGRVQDLSRSMVLTTCVPWDRGWQTCRNSGVCNRLAGLSDSEAIVRGEDGKIAMVRPPRWAGKLFVVEHVATVTSPVQLRLCDYAPGCKSRLMRASGTSTHMRLSNGPMGGVCTQALICFIFLLFFFFFLHCTVSPVRRCIGGEAVGFRVTFTGWVCGAYRPFTLQWCCLHFVFGLSYCVRRHVKRNRGSTPELETGLASRSNGQSLA